MPAHCDGCTGELASDVARDIARSFRAGEMLSVANAPTEEDDAEYGSSIEANLGSMEARPNLGIFEIFSDFP